MFVTAFITVRTKHLTKYISAVVMIKLRGLTFHISLKRDVCRFVVCVSLGFA